MKSVNNELKGCVDGNKIADTCRDHISKSYTDNDASRAAYLKSEYTRRRSSYEGFTGSVCDCNFHIEIVRKIIQNLTTCSAIAERPRCRVRYSFCKK